MLSAVILSRHSYGAVQLVLQPPDQRSVHFGPLVASSPLSWSADYILILPPIGGPGSRHVTYASSQLLRADSTLHKSGARCTTVVTGSNLETDLISP